MSLLRSLTVYSGQAKTDASFVLKVYSTTRDLLSFPLESYLSTHVAKHTIYEEVQCLYN